MTEVKSIFPEFDIKVPMPSGPAMPAPSLDSLLCEAVEVLRSVEWATWYNGYMSCPLCRAMYRFNSRRGEPDPHKSGCRLAAVLKAYEARAAGEQPAEASTK